MSQTFDISYDLGIAGRSVGKKMVGDRSVRIEQINVEASYDPIAMKINRLDELKQKLLNDADLSQIWSFYMDEFADIPEFLDVGKPKQDELLTAILPQVCQQIFGQTTKIKQLFPIYIAQYQFFHAPFFADKRIGGLIYFEDIHTGLIAVSAHFPATSKVHYSRFSTSPAPTSVMKGFGRKK